MLRSLSSTGSPSIAATARRIRRWRGSRMQANPSAATVTLFASSRAVSAALGFPKM
jgi:hypothetical protein